ncbi:kinesin-like protein KIN-14S [Cornus florida]|uniref:kinesin-like protein KIN-14S n=1 Tax=Cornus florida TaxID=4283 RepID=UPI00289E092E|nr:kinesin-like protein KIN-14S [Cornus florida]
MEDQTLETLSHNSEQIISGHNTDPSLTCETDQTLETATCGTEPVEVNSDLMDESNVSNGTQETCSDGEQTLPILQKVKDLSKRVQFLKKEHASLCIEVKDLTADSFPGFEILNALQGLSAEHELLKKKYDEECKLLKKKYLEESFERKRLYNEVIELKGNIRVFCRCRPLNQGEIANGTTSIVDFDSSQENELQVIGSDSSRKHFKFDHVFRPEDNQETVFAQTSPVVTSVLDGYNVCIFAYGQTGTGKTFTMEGTYENRGVNYRTLEALFGISIERSSITKYELFVSMLEVYNEKIRDLLAENSNQPAKKLDIKQSAEGTQEVPGLVEARVYGTDEVWELLKTGSQARSVGSTNANELSSRSHCLLRVTVKGENLVNGQRTKSHLWLVDLAGSERVGKIEVEGERLKESQFINKSLSALGDVISALASKTTHVPYRNSKLTHMLQSSLGGDCKTLMFVQISPSASDLGETLCSLNFASRVRGIEHGAARKQADLTELFKYRQLAEKAKHDEKETKKLQDSLQSLQLRLGAREHICRNLQEKVRDLELQLAEERKTRLKQESRALGTAASAHSPAMASLKQSQKTVTTDRRPPLGPSRLRLPLRRITNFMPPPTPLPPPHKPRTSSILPVSTDDKENISKTMMAASKTRTLLKPRRGSIAVRPPPPTTNQVLQPKRRASIATLRCEPNMMTPLNSSNARLKKDRVMGRQSFVWDPQRVWRTSRRHSPLPELKEAGAAAVEATPSGPRSSKFMGSPPTGQAGSWKPKHPTVVALQRKQLVWSPLKLRGMRSNRNSLLPS